ncbi:MAG: hypothetical protein JHC33_12005 [Ignisphaera sp.]|nr:hypothetical protein [Ignisphaera sp.]
MKINTNKKYTSGDKPIRILCTDRASGTYPIVGLRNNLDITYFTEDGRSIDGKAYDLIELWEPQKDEWCLFWDNIESNHFVLARFVKMTAYGNFYSYPNGTWIYCSKFTGELPEHLKNL